MIIEITDNNTPMLQAIRTVSRDVAFEQMSKIGNKVRVNAGKNMTSKRHNWFQKETKKGRRSPYLSKSKSKELGISFKIKIQRAWSKN